MFARGGRAAEASRVRNDVEKEFKESGWICGRGRDGRISELGTISKRNLKSQDGFLARRREGEYLRGNFEGNLKS